MQDKEPIKEFWQISLKWLKSCGVELNKEYVRDEIVTHQDYPSLTALTDFLDSGSMKYLAVEGSQDYLSAFQYPLLAHIDVPGEQYMRIIETEDDWHSHPGLLQNWSGIVLMPTDERQWYNDDHQEVHKKARQMSIVFISICILMFVSLFIMSRLTIDLYNIWFSLLSILGVAFGLVLFVTELGFQNHIVKQVCGALSDDGCEKVLNSRYASGFLGITPADLTLLYFSSQYVFLFICIFSGVNSSLSFVLSYIGIFPAVWSIYTQSVLIKKWCVLCLGVVTILILQFVLVQFYPPIFLDFKEILIFMAVLLLLLLILYPIKALLKTIISNKKSLLELKKFKSDPGLFLYEWEKGISVDTEYWDNEIIIGEPKAPIRVTIACNPYCDPCAQAHFEMEKIMERYPANVCLQIKFLSFNFSNNPLAQKIDEANSLILNTLIKLDDSLEVKKAVDDWFRVMDISQWKKRWRQDDSIDVAPLLSRHFNWISTNQITYTPTIFINGKKLPGLYALKDFAAMIPGLLNYFDKTE
ncbi:MAG: hypothetical protein EOO20_04050 [Chryseobacterium sp.]|nr:MAG: hypothetical protein EOO20_04050 [Chryseobacterium sp.]